MSDVIKLLPDSVANQIAAGEVIQRPASVIKELVENAVDAGAYRIDIILKDAGRTLIQVIDNGSGMSATDARLAFERHSTSKISSAADLFTLHTMGFRGEALASICAISQVELKTMRHGEAIGTRLLINGSKFESQEPTACQPGTNIMVKNLFFNVPARRKFLKKDSVELSNIMHEFERLALVNTDVEFTIVHNGVTLHQLMQGSLKQRINDLFGKNLDKQLLPLEADTTIVHLTGFVGLPEYARRRGALQYFFVNGRNMRHPYFHRAVLSCYDQLIAPDVQPCYFINFEVDAETIDVNIHPTKNEIKFENEQPIFQILMAAVRESLGRFSAGPSIDFDSVDVPEIPPFKKDAKGRVDIPIDKSYNPFTNQSTPPRQPSARNWEQLYSGFESQRGQSAQPLPDLTPDIPTIESLQQVSQSSIDDSGEDMAPQILRFKNQYLMLPTKSGLLIINQHRAQVKILYERYMADVSQGKAVSQNLLFPESLTLTPSQNVAMSSAVEQLAACGFDLSFLGNNTWAINGVPPMIVNSDAVETLLKIVDNIADLGDDAAADVINHKIALSMAQSTAIRTGQALSDAEAESIVSELLQLTTPNFTPDGQVVLSVVNTADIQRLFTI
ncbi:MAG: DNA mismatch repair endonuclease MutL [Muribaculaceae bacterium]|nr:DNA mismatch repair endonuclease MutL [Muribaculaceae bacterium]